MWLQWSNGEMWGPEWGGDSEEAGDLSGEATVKHRLEDICLPGPDSTLTSCCVALGKFPPSLGLLSCLQSGNSTGTHLRGSLGGLNELIYANPLEKCQVMGKYQ